MGIQDIQDIKETLIKVFKQTDEVLAEDRPYIVTTYLKYVAKEANSKGNDISNYFKVCRSIVKKVKATIDQDISNYRAGIDMDIFNLENSKDYDADTEYEIELLEQEKTSLSQIYDNGPFFSKPDYVFIYVFKLGGDLVLKCIDEAEAELIASTIKPTEDNKQTFSDLLKCDASKKKAIIDYMKGEFEKTKKPNRTAAFLILALIEISYLNEIISINDFFNNILKGTFSNAGSRSAFGANYNQYSKNKELQKQPEYSRYVEEIKKLA